MTTSRKTHPSLYFILILFLYSIKGKKGHIWKMVIFSGFLVLFLLALCSVSSLFFATIPVLHVVWFWVWYLQYIYGQRPQIYACIHKKTILSSTLPSVQCRFELPLMDSAASHWAIEYHRCAEYTNCSN